MTPAELQRAGVELFGESWKAKLSRAVGRSFVTIWRQSAADPGAAAEVSKPVAAAVDAWMLLSRAFREAPPDTPAEGLPICDDRLSQPWDGTPATLDAAGELLFGHGWPMKMSMALGIDPTSLWRQRNKELSGPVTAAVTGWIAIRLRIGLCPPARPGEPYEKPRDIKTKSHARSMAPYARLMLDDGAKAPGPGRRSVRR